MHQPPFPHQVEGINWLLFKWLEGRDVVLADEMGLGKTFQVSCCAQSLWPFVFARLTPECNSQSISVLGLLRSKFRRDKFLVIAPLSTVPNWLREFQRFAPDMDVVVFGGNEESRTVCLQHDLKYEHAFEVSR